MKVADGFIQNAGTHPSRRLPAGIGEIAIRDANPQSIIVAIIPHPKVGNGSVGAADGDGGGVGGVGGKNLGSSAARNSLLNGLDVCRVAGTGKQGRKREGCTGKVGLVGVEKVSVDSPSISRILSAGGSEARADRRCRGSAKNPEGLVGGVVLAGIDVDEHLRLALFDGNKRRKRRDDQGR